MKFIIACIVFFLTTTTSIFAYAPEVVVQKSLLDVSKITNPTLAQTFFGALAEFPHTYEIIATEPFHLFVQISVPNIESSADILSGIIIKEPSGKGRVEEIARLPAQSATWDSSYEWWSGDSYRKGPSFEKDLGPGTYRIEVNTPNNREKYILQVGTENEMVFGYFETVRRIVAVKKFFEKSPLRVVESPLILIPLLSIAGVWMLLWYRRRKQRGGDGILENLNT